VAATGITGKDSSFLRPTVRVDYVPTLKGSWLFNGSYSFSANQQTPQLAQFAFY
jgi:hypothetical protein